MKKLVWCCAAALMMAIAGAETTVNVTVSGLKKTSVKIAVENPAFKKCLARNLELTGLFTVGNAGEIMVSGVSGALKVEGCGKTISSISSYTDDASARTAARRLSDLMCDAYGDGQKGFAQDKVLFLNRGKPVKPGAPIPAELVVSYPDGMDVRRLTSDGRMVIFQRWIKNTDDVIYISDKSGAPQIWRMNTKTGARSVMWTFKGSPTGLSVSPDGTKVAAILSVHGNPELYVIEMGSGNWTRLTKTPNEVEGQPTWSPDGRQIAFVRGVKAQQIWVIDINTMKERRLTSKGGKNVDPDWGKDGRIAYVSGQYVAVMDAKVGDRSAEFVTDAANWEHPSWSRDGRHLTASHNNAVFVVDTKKDGTGLNKPMQMFYSPGNWTAPCWAR